MLCATRRYAIQNATHCSTWPALSTFKLISKPGWYTSGFSKIHVCLKGRSYLGWLGYDVVYRYTGESPFLMVEFIKGPLAFKNFLSFIYGFFQ